MLFLSDRELNGTLIRLDCPNRGTSVNVHEQRLPVGAKTGAGEFHTAVQVSREVETLPIR